MPDKTTPVELDRYRPSPIGRWSNMEPISVRLASVYVDSLPDKAFTKLPDSEYPAFAPEAVEAITDEVMEFIAYVVSIGIDMGSERDAVMENDKLRDAIYRELRGWAYPAPEGE